MSNNDVVVGKKMIELYFGVKMKEEEMDVLDRRRSTEERIVVGLRRNNDTTNLLIIIIRDR